MRITDDDLGPDPTSQALIRLVPTLGPIVATWRDEMFERKQQRTEKLGSAAAEDVGAEQFFEQVAASERLTDMFIAAVESATATSSDAKIRLLGRVLAAGTTAEDEARVDSAEQLLRIALELDPVDLRALRALERWQSRDAAATVAFALDLDPSIANPIVARLERLHLISVERQASIYDKQSPDDDSVDILEEWGTTSTATAVLDLLRSRNDPQDSDAVRRDGAPWSGFTEAQSLQLEKLAYLSQHDWPSAVDPDQPVALALRKLDALGAPYLRVRTALRSVGYSRRELELLDRWADKG